jgi:hypothetical protein
LTKRIDSFGFRPGRLLGSGYVVEESLGTGTEGEVYRVTERDTGISRAAKLHFPHIDPDHRKSMWHARKLNALRACPIVLQYHHSETVRVRGRRTLVVVSEFCPGLQLQRWVERQRGKRLTPYMALHLLHELVSGLELIHAYGEYHSDVHTENILVNPIGVRLSLKLIDFYDWGRPSRVKQQNDVLCAIRVFYDVLGGREHYRKLPPEIKRICIGMQSSRILKRFPTMYALRAHLETFEWDTLDPAWR